MSDIKVLVTVVMLVSSGSAFTFKATGLDPPPAQDVLLEYGVRSSTAECALACLNDAKLCAGFRFEGSLCKGVPAPVRSNASATSSQNQFHVLQYHAGPMECVYGPYGRAVGVSLFNFSMSPDRGHIKRVDVYWFHWITGLAIQYSDGSNDSVIEGKSAWKKSFVIPDGETIMHTTVRFSTNVDSLSFVTDKGTKSERLGGTHGTHEDEIRGFGLQGILGEYKEGPDLRDGVQRMSFVFSKCP
ncbi:hypothetical protein CAPTEDRAFT_218574 [Capitella teleta]|uniref:Apple domain-containing protein n=1 Tax=Capitella teleta TaxID=283909 RepID=R7TZM1_CAPTE|nr:hypothetical protein CAPTEDRAFT_218574 [Capitella teleta]|eukprot:ELT96370.1 hypothetical protein CAPTEDRAFT_218574 [Capitella teleta]